ncbi:TraB/GumN family protein [Vibrio hannami]|uniref:TraB/GumN family protein n=1 Tax=Vibrio hannami TaxID=2717094 RepID=UPI00240F57A5|nr:TraB/GumN family protein [Vibrio hannami]MDG3088822.1 TraB/GumN family protein [Vibrio hannami]
MVNKFSISIAILLLSLAGLANAEPLYWKATKGDKELMILGSIHLGKEEMLPLPKAVNNFLDSSDALILEADLDSASAGVPDVNELSNDYLNRKQKAKIRKIGAEVGIDGDVLLSQPTWKTALVLQLAYFYSLGYKHEWGIDNYIANQARLNDIPVKGLETVEYQLSLFSNSKQIGRDLLNEIVDEWEKNKRISECLMNDWMSGDKNKLESLVLETSGSDEIASKFIYERNREWADKLDSPAFLKEDGRYLVVVGTLHLVGQDSLISLLKSKGFRIKQLSKSVASTCPAK